MIRLLTILSFLSVNAHAANYYFAATGHGGSDGNSGTLASPYATITKLNTLTLAPGDTIKFNGGDPFTGTVTQTTNQVVYCSYGTGKAILSGYSTALQSTSAWTNVSGNIWQASLNSGWGLDVVTLSGNFVQMGRTPNNGSYFNIDSHTNPDGHGNPNAFFEDQPGYDVSATSSSLTSTWTGAFSVVRVNDYQMDRLLITSQSGTTMTVNTHSANQWSDNWKFFIEGALATLDVQGEWFYDRTAHTVSMYSTTNPATAGYLFSQYNSAMFIGGNSGSYEHDIVINNLSFQGYDSVAIAMNYCFNVTIQNCSIDLTGWHAIEGGIHIGNVATATCSNISILNNSITNNGGCGVFFNYSNGLFIKNNNITNSGINEGMGTKRIGIHVYHPGNLDSVSIFNNTVFNSGYSGIYWQGQKVLIIYNDVNEFGLLLTDAGGIYTSFGDEDGSTGYRKVYYNIIRNGHGGTQGKPTGSVEGGMPGIYNDDGSRFIDESYNSIYNVTRAAIFWHNNEYITANHNTISGINGDAAILSSFDSLPPVTPTRVVEAQYNIIYSGNLVSSYTGYTPFAIQLYSITGNDYASYGIFNNNIYAKTTATGLVRAGVTTYDNLASWNPAYGYDANSIFKQVNNDSIMVVSNPTMSTSSVLFPGLTYRDLQDNNYSDNLSLGPFESKIVRKVTYIPAGSPSPSTFIYTNPSAGRKRNHKVY